MDGGGTWLDRAWDHPAGRLLVILVTIVATTALLDVFGRDPDYVGAAAPGVAVWPFCCGDSAVALVTLGLAGAEPVMGAP